MSATEPLRSRYERRNLYNKLESLLSLRHKSMVLKKSKKVDITYHQSTPLIVCYFTETSAKVWWQHQRSKFSMADTTVYTIVPSLYTVYKLSMTQSQRQHTDELKRIVDILCCIHDHLAIFYLNSFYSKAIFSSWQVPATSGRPPFCFQKRQPKQGCDDSI
jgi:hypothetical protein